MEALELLAQQVERLQKTCDSISNNTAVLSERFDEFDRKLFGNGQPGEIDRHKTQLAGVLARVGKLETVQAERQGAAQVWGALAGGLMWGVGIAFQWFWQKVRTGH